MTKLKVRGLKWKRLKVRESVLHFCLELIIGKWRNPYDLPKLRKKTWKWQHIRKAWVIFFKHLLWLALLSYENKYSSLLENKGEVYNKKNWHLLDIACRFHQTLVYFLAWFGIISNLREKTLKVSNILRDCISYVIYEAWILELWYQRNLHNEEMSWGGARCISWDKLKWSN